MSIEGFEKFEHIPGDLETHMQVWRYTHAQERPEKVLIPLPWLTLRQCGGR